MPEELDTDRVAVRTYVPAYQREEWDGHADELDMSRAEFVRTMVQAGRRGFDLDDESPDRESNPPEGGPEAATPGVGGLEDRVLSLLEAERALSWEELVEGLTDDLEERLDEVLDDLQDANRVRHSGRQGGYAVISDGE